MNNDLEAIFLKIIIVGDPGVGKTSILTQYCFKRFEESTRPTIGCDFNTIIHHTKSNKVIKAQLWDIAGQEKFQAVSKLYVRGAQGGVIVCDVLNEKSLQSTLKWKDLINNDPFFMDSEDHIPIVLVQNKIDLLNKETLQEFEKPEYLENFTKENDFFAGFQTSAKTSENLQAVFETLVEEILARKIARIKKKSTEGVNGRRESSLDLVNKTKGETETGIGERKCC